MGGLSGSTALSVLRLRTPGCKSFPVCAGFKYVQVKKVKITFVQALRLCTGRTAHKGSRGIPLLL